MLIVERPSLAWKAWKDVGAVMGEATPGPGPCSFSTRRISWVAEDELQEEEYLGISNPLCPKLFYIVS